MMFPPRLLLGLACLVAACSGGEPSPVMPPPDASPVSMVLPKGADPAAELDTVLTGMTLSRPDVGQTAVFWGEDNDVSAVYAAWRDDPDIGPSPVFDLSYSGTWRVVMIDMEEQVTQDGGSFLLTADVSAGTLTGSSGAFVLNGTFSGGGVGGTVVYDGITAPVSGAIGTGGAIGAFAGEDRDRVMAGGFVGH